MTSNYPPGVTDQNFDKLCWNETYRFNRTCMCCHEPVSDQADQEFCSYCEPDVTEGVEEDIAREVVEVCPHCESENEFEMTDDQIIQAKGKVFCQACWDVMLLCSECLMAQCEKQPDCFQFRPIEEEPNEHDPT